MQYSPKKWSDDEETRLIDMIKGGKSMAEIAKTLGRTEKAVMIRQKDIACKVQRLGIDQKIITEKTMVTAEDLKYDKLDRVNKLVKEIKKLQSQLTFLLRGDPELSHKLKSSHNDEDMSEVLKALDDYV